MKFKWAFPILVPMSGLGYKIAFEIRNGWLTPMETKVLNVMATLVLMISLLVVIQPWKQAKSEVVD